MNNSTVLFKEFAKSLPVRYEFKAVFFAADTLVALVSAVGNVLVITTFLRTKTLRTSTNYYITTTTTTSFICMTT